MVFFSTSSVSFSFSTKKSFTDSVAWSRLSLSSFTSVRCPTVASSRRMRSVICMMPFISELLSLAAIFLAKWPNGWAAELTAVLSAEVEEEANDEPMRPDFTFHLLAAVSTTEEADTDDAADEAGASDTDGAAASAPLLLLPALVVAARAGAMGSRFWFRVEPMPNNVSTRVKKGRHACAALSTEEACKKENAFSNTLSSNTINGAA
mmetsp:Transcript_41573/g.81746  ORF Transcript_41573/g.81746 Transcript_41573/m.81746 type:complete len:207 (+) Transcript_41573:118-738(+)